MGAIDICKQAEICNGGPAIIEIGFVIDFFTKLFYYVKKRIDSKGKIYIINPDTRDASEVVLSLRGLLFPKPSVIPIIPGTYTLIILGVLSWGKPQLNVIEFKVEDSEYHVDYSDPVIVYLHTFEGASSREKAEQQPLRSLPNVDVEINNQPIGRTDENGI